MIKRTLCALALIGAATAAQADVIENFNNVAVLAAKGWILSNVSTPLGTTSWAQGDVGVFGAQSGADNSYITANYRSAQDGGTISDYLLTSEFSTKYKGVVSFWARGANDDGFSDSFSYGLGTGTDGSTFAFLPEVVATKDGWTNYIYAFAGTGLDTVGRFGIHYSGAADTSNYIGFDALQVTLPEPSTPLMLGLGMAGLFVMRRRKQAKRA